MHELPKGPAILRPASGLNGLSNAPTALIQTGIGCSWSGLFGLSGNPQGSTNIRCFTLGENTYIYTAEKLALKSRGAHLWIISCAMLCCCFFVGDGVRGWDLKIRNIKKLYSKDKANK